METFSTLLALCAGNSPVSSEFPTQRPVTRNFNVFFDLLLNKRLSKQSWGWWFETLSSPLAHYDAIVMVYEQLGAQRCVHGIAATGAMVLKIQAFSTQSAN